MKQFVLDCSVAISWCFEDESQKRSKDLLLLMKQATAIVPAIWELEICNVLIVAERSERLTGQQSEQFVKLLCGLPIEVDNAGILINKEILKLSRSSKLSAYDAAYLELALRNEIPLASFDKQLCATATAVGIKIL